ncbi:MAG TPA: alpha/beta hydrolase-fold protein [Armatimonadota bacterium]|jgi:enterochelin esterase family protein
MLIRDIPRWLFTLALLASLSAAEPAHAEEAGVEPLASPRLAALARDVEAGHRDAMDAFWRQVQGKAPLVEPVHREPRSRRVTFLWRGDANVTSVALLGGGATAGIAKPMARLADTDLWYLTETHPSRARFEYFFLVNEPSADPRNVSELMRAMERGQPRPDLLNPKEFAGRSYVELPDAPPQPWIVRKPGAPVGRLTQRTFQSRALKAEYPLSVYTPPGYDKRRDRCWLLVAFDGGFPMMEVTLDNLIAAGKIPPVVVVGVNNVSQDARNRDLSGSAAYAAFLKNELAPWARKTYRVYPDAPHTIVGGVSLGGFMAAYCGLKQSSVFGNVLALSPTLVLAPGQAQPNDVWDEEPSGLLPRQFAAAPRQPVRFYLEAGRYEHFYPVSLISQARRLRDVLQAKGYDIAYAEFVGGHNAVCWRGAFANGMMALTRTKSPRAKAAWNARDALSVKLGSCYDGRLAAVFRGAARRRVESAGKACLAPTRQALPSTDRWSATPNS